MTYANARFIWLALACAIAAVFFIGIDFKGVYLTPDGWGYWQGAVSIAEGKGYTYFSGNPIISWPPLYSLYLAAWTLPFGTSGITLLVANGALIVVQAGLWFRLSFVLADNDKSFSNGLLAPLTVAVYVGIFVPIYEPWALAQNLLYLLLPLHIESDWRAIRENGRRALAACAANVVISTLCLLTHSSSVGFVCASCGLFALFGRGSLVRRAVISVAMLLIPILIWSATRSYLGQQESHAINFDGGLASFVVNLDDMLHGLAQFVVPNSTPLLLATAMILAVAVVMVRAGAGSFALTYGCLYVAIALLVLVCIFSVTSIASTPAGRFLLFAPLVIIPATIREASGSRYPALLAVLALLILPMLTMRAAKWIFIVPHVSAVQDGKPALGHFPLDAELSRVPGKDATIIVNNRLLIGPIGWEEEAWGAIHATRSSPATPTETQKVPPPGR